MRGIAEIGGMKGLSAGRGFSPSMSRLERKEAAAPFVKALENKKSSANYAATE
jgi:hypothetical protein